MTPLMCFDLDGTLTKYELLPIIAREVDLYDEIMALTNATIMGHIPFQQSFKLRCKLLSEVPVSTVREIVSTVDIFSHLQEFIQQNSSQCKIVTGNLDVWISGLTDTFGCEVFSSKANVVNDKLENVKEVIEKGDVVRELSRGGNRVISIGDGMGDVSMFEASNVGIAFGGVHKPIKSLIEYSNFLVYEEKSLCNLLKTL